MFDPVQPVEVGFEYVPCEAVVEEQDALAVRDRRGNGFGDIEPCEQIGDVGAQCAQALENGLNADEVRCEQAHGKPLPPQRKRPAQNGLTPEVVRPERLTESALA
jgi:hypothetical protein